MNKKAFGTITFEPTLRCNANCCMCYQREARGKDLEISTTQIVKVLDKLEAQWLWLMGGEVFLRSDLLDIIDYASGRGWEVGLTTNGFLIDERMAAELADRPKLRTVVYSLDGPQVIHNAIRGTSRAYELVTRAIRLTQATKQTWINFVLNAATAVNLPNTVREAASLGVRKVNVIFQEAYQVDEVDRSRKMLAEILGWHVDTYVLAVSDQMAPIQSWSSEKAWLSVLHAAKEQALRSGIDLVCSSQFQSLPYANDYRAGTLREKYRLYCANSVNRNLRLNPSGQVIACDTIRRPLAQLPEECDDIEDMLTEFYGGLSRVNYLPICTRCCKIRAVKE